MIATAQDLALSKAGVFARCAFEALLLLRNPRALLFFLPQALLLGSLLGGLMHFHLASLSPVWVPIVQRIAGEDALHYPRFFEELPAVYGALEAIVLGVACSLGWAAFVHALPRLFEGDAPHARASARAALRRTPAVWAVFVPLALLQAGALVFVEHLRGEDIADSPRLFGLAQLVCSGVVLLPQILTLYVLPSLMLGKQSVFRALALSISLATRNFWTTAGFILVPRLAEAPIRAFTQNLPSWYGIIDPDATGLLVALRALISVAAMLLTLAASGRLYLHAFGGADE
jgi:hypothetical protein